MTCFGALTGLCCIGLLAGFVVFVHGLDDQEVVRVPHADGIVALTGGAERISDAADLVSTGHADRLLITGVNPAISAEEMARHTPSLRPLFDCCIDLGYDALNTVGNAAETRRWAQSHGIRRRLIIVTSNYHMPRALLEIGRELPGLELVPFPVVTEKSRSSLWADATMTRVVALEYLKYLAALARGAIMPATPEVALEGAPAKGPRTASHANVER